VFMPCTFNENPLPRSRIRPSREADAIVHRGNHGGMGVRRRSGMRGQPVYSAIIIETSLAR
jgi:hypothetical protein